jgi:hypothetical protein
MTVPRSGQRPLPRSFTRRQVALGFAALGAGVALGAPRRGASALQFAGAGLTPLATYTNWRRTWDLIVPVLAERAFPRTFLLYDRAAGNASLIAVDASGGIREVRTFLDWRKTWDSIVPSRFPQVVGLTGLIAYDGAAGVVSMMQIDAFGNVQELQTYPNWRRSWAAFVPFGPNGLLVYDRAAGYATDFTIDPTGSLRELRSFNDWRQTWDLLTSGPFTSGDLPGRDLLLYDRTTRQAAGLTIGPTGDAIRFADYAGWRTTWTVIAGGLFLLRGSATSATADLLLFDQSAQELEFLDIGPGNALASLLLTATPGVNAWTTVTPIGPNLLLLYDRAAGTAGFYATDRAPLPVPSPTPAPTAVPPTPTPAIVPTGRVNVRLEQGKGNAWNTYTGKAGDPATGGSRTSIITGVKNTADKRIALIHRDRSEKRVGPVFLKASELSTAFNGLAVAGDWEAVVTGSQSEAPPRVILEVRYEVR